MRHWPPLLVIIVRQGGEGRCCSSSLVGVIVAYGGIVGALYLTQRSLMYLPGLARVSPAAAGLPQAEEVTLTTGRH